MTVARQPEHCGRIVTEPTTGPIAEPGACRGRTVVFDLDGTLIDSDDALVRPFLALGVPLSEISFGHPIIEECARLDISVDDYVAAYDTASVEPYEGVEAMLARLSRWAVCSNKAGRSATAELARLGWDPAVALFAEDFGGRAKRLAPVIDALGLTGDQILYVGDTDHDRQAAADAGTAFAWAGWNPRTATASAGGTVLRRPSDVLVLLGIGD